jgi:hypothetical protein
MLDLTVRTPMKRILAVLSAPILAISISVLTSAALAQGSPALEQAYLEDLPVVLSVSRLAQPIEIDFAGGHHLGSVVIVDQSRQKMLKRHIFVAVFIR